MRGENEMDGIEALHAFATQNKIKVEFGAPRERPILFNAAMVRAILSGTKTQTRRPMKPQPPGDEAPLAVEWFTPSVIRANGEMEPADEDVFGAYAEEWSRVCPFGAPGDRLWVRETWTPIVGEDFADGTANVVFQAGGSHALAGSDRCGRPREMPQGTRWRPSIHMPRWASRLTLEVTGVRVERAAGISTEDIIAEGLSTALREHDAEVHLSDQWRGLIASIYGEAFWEANGWMWVVDFKRVQP
jgi:hypothetical protein